MQCRSIRFALFLYLNITLILFYFNQILSTLKQGRMRDAIVAANLLPHSHLCKAVSPLCFCFFSGHFYLLYRFTFFLLYPKRFYIVMYLNENFAKLVLSSIYM